jgi:hypothetical protein
LALRFETFCPQLKRLSTGAYCWPAMSIDLDCARGPSARVAWHAWPLAILVTVGAVTGILLARSMRPDLHVAATDRLQTVQVLLGFLALGHLVLNVVAFFVDKERLPAQRLAELCSVGLTLALLLLLFASPIPFGMFLPRG